MVSRCADIVSCNFQLFLTLQSVVEKVTYKPSNEFPGKTIAYRSAWIDSELYGFAPALRAFGVERFKKNCNKTVISPLLPLTSLNLNLSFQILGFNHVLQSMYPSAFLPQKDITLSAAKIKEATKSVSEHVKAQAEQIYQAYSVKN